MATSGHSPSVVECEICAEQLKNSRTLNCGHVFCLNCLETLESNKIIQCPVCREETDIPIGLLVKHLPKKMLYSSGKATRSKVCSLHLIKAWTLDDVTDVPGLEFDEENRIIIIGTDNAEESILMYSLMGQKMGTVRTEGMDRVKLGWDTKRRLILATTGETLVLFDDEGRKVGTLKPKAMDIADDVTYLKATDQYVIADHNAHKLHFISAETETVSASVTAEECRGTQQGYRNIYLFSSKNSQKPLIATLDQENCIVKIRNKDGEFFRTIGGKGSGYGKIKDSIGICFDKSGRILVSERGNKRLARFDPGAEDFRHWEVIMDTTSLGLGSPASLFVTEDGIIILIMREVIKDKETRVRVALLGGYV